MTIIKITKTFISGSIIGLTLVDQLSFVSIEAVKSYCRVVNGKECGGGYLGPKYMARCEVVYE
jgi:hypothetical protein